MEISEVRVKLVGGTADRLRAYCSVTLDDQFVIRDLKIIDGPSGPFVAMPSRKLADRCPKCSAKNHLRAKFCNTCGARLGDNRVPHDRSGRSKLHADVAHPINSACREWIQERVIQAYQAEITLSQQPGYVPKALDEDEMLSDYDELTHEEAAEAPPSRSHTAHSAGPPPAETGTGTGPATPNPSDVGQHRAPAGPQAKTFGEGIL